MTCLHALRAFCAIALLAVPALPALADSIPTPSPSPSAIPEIVHVVTSDRSDETLRNATRTTYVVTREEIDRNGFRTIGDALADVPGVEITRYGPVGQNVSYGIRGSSSAQVLVLVDGAPAPGGFANSVQFGTMSTVGVRRVEVVEGGGSTLYGTGAIGGIINVITDAQGAPPSATGSLGTFGDRDLRLQAHGLSIERIVAENTFALPPSETSGVANPTTHSNGDDETSSLRYGLDRKLGSLDVALRAGLENDRLGAAGVFPYLSPSSRENDVNAESSLNLALQRKHAKTTLELGGSRQQIAFACDIVTDANCFFPVPALSTESRVSMDVRTSVVSKNDRVLYGVDLSRGNVREDDGSGTGGSIATAALAQSAAYVQEAHQSRNGEFYVGLRGERDGSLGGEFSPSAGWRAQLRNGLEVKLNAASAFRAPNASELYFPGYGYAALRPERAQVGDVTVSDGRAFGGISLAWFTNRTNDLIVADPANNYAPRNVDHALIQGFTFEAGTRPVHGITIGIRATDLYRAQDIDSQQRLPNDPVFTIVANLRIRGSASSLFDEAGIAVRAVGARGTVDRTQPLFYQPSEYSTLDAYSRFRVARSTLLTLRGYNLGNERYAEVGGYPMPGRTFVLELTTK
ncbi:MAG TPA: TonB-dependent receptor [Candidatus Baltobacteraceae bacterium]|jgi:vitamin B12 transporter|nr:TonB-dependent receptor [Candidatus Baltobacteraceae bacterium]